ncbi:MAG: hypothetical protein LBI18_07685, partial [Planctomycetaceae bacterium]|nr:hypothetical protein [Planctomycetaceae bacterium]
MKTLELPYLRFGRNKENATEFYTVLEQSPSISQDIVSIFSDRIAKSIQWESSEDTAEYTDCFLIWVTEYSDFLFAKLSDNGNDFLKRNHSMLIDAVYLTKEQLPKITHEKATFFASLCFSSAWQFWEQDRILQPVEEKEQKVKELAEKILFFFSESDSSFHSLFIASHSYFTPRGIDRIVYNNQRVPNNKQIDSETKTNRDSNSTLLVSPSSSVFFPAKYLFYVLIILLILSVIGGGWWAMSRYYNLHNELVKLRADHNLLQIEQDRKIRESEKLQEENSKIQDVANQQSRIIKEKDKEIKERDTKIKKLENEQKELSHQLENAYRNANQSLKNENESLKTQNNQLDQKIKK